MSTRIVLVVAGLVIVAGVAWLTLRGSEQRGPASTTSAISPDTPVPVDGAVSTTAGGSTNAADEPALPQVAPPRPTADARAILVSPGFEYLNTPLTEMPDTHGDRHLVVRHNELQGEPRDESWAPRIEEMLSNGIRDSLTSHGVDDQRIELSVVECRSTGCEIQAIGYREDNGKQGVDLQTIVPRMMLAASWGAEFDQNLLMTMRVRPDGRIGFLVFLNRKTP